jgi:hypothetical protein
VVDIVKDVGVSEIAIFSNLCFKPFLEISFKTLFFFEKKLFCFRIRS